MVETSSSSGYDRRLKEERRRLGMTQAELAAEVGVSTATQVAYEQAARRPGLDYLVSLQNAGGDVWYVMFGLRAERRAVETMDWELFADIHFAVADWCRQRRIDLPHRKLIEVSRLLYEQFVSDGVVQPDAVERILKLVA